MKGIVYYNDLRAGILEKNTLEDYRFEYDHQYLQNRDNPSVSLTLPKAKTVYTSPVLFPFFSGLLSEGINKEIQCRLLKIDEADEFKRLLMSAGEDTIGAVTVKKSDE